MGLEPLSSSCYANTPPIHGGCQKQERGKSLRGHHLLVSLVTVDHDVPNMDLEAASCRRKAMFAGAYHDIKS